MSVEDINVIDFIGVDSSSRDVVMTVADHLDWKEPQHHVKVLQDKLNTYIRFFESGELYESYPDANQANIRIEVILKYEADDIGMRFFEAVTPVLNGIGLGFRATLKESETGQSA